MGTDDDVDAMLEAAYAVDGPDANRTLYADWADSYDETFIEPSGYVYHRRVAESLLAGFDPESGPVLDVGCGTGVVGVALRDLGVTHVDGIDISAEMLDRAGEKQVDGAPVYRELIEADLTAEIDLDDDRYAGVVSAGTFTHGHLGPEALGEVIRVARPGARFAIGINSAHFEELGFRTYLDDQVSASVITAYELVDAPIYGDTGSADPDHVARVATFAVR
ncbi:MAG: class I SAM-dependent DNA methyltransferase [Ilumatobacteraceae bacterium]